VNIEIDSIPLVRTEQNQAGAVVEVSNISNMQTSDKRNVIEHEIPGMEGNVFQNLGRSAVRISFDGTFQGKTAKNKIELIRSKFKQGTPLPFNSDISGATDVTKVMIEDLKVTETAGLANKFEYSILLREYKEPPPEPTTPPSQDGQAEEWADEVASETMDSINYITGKVLDSEGNPKSGVSVLVTGDDGEHKLETDEEGIYRVDDLPPGDYKVKVDLEEYEGIEKEVTIGGGAGGETGAAEGGEEETTSQAETGTESTQAEEGEVPAGEEKPTEDVTSSDEESTQEQRPSDEEKTPGEETAEKPTSQTESDTESSQVEGDEQTAGGEKPTEDVTSSDEESTQEQRPDDEEKTPQEEPEESTSQTESDAESSQVEDNEQPAGEEKPTEDVTSSDEESTQEQRPDDEVKTPGEETAEKSTSQTESSTESSQVEGGEQPAGEEKPTEEVPSSNEESTQEQRPDDEVKTPKEEPEEKPTSQTKSGAGSLGDEEELLQG